ncbi:DUF3850 domain-containing protein [Bacillus cereus]
MLHNLKINQEFFSPVVEQIKTFEIRNIQGRKLMGKLHISQTMNKKKIMWCLVLD